MCAAVELADKPEKVTLMVNVLPERVTVPLPEPVPPPPGSWPGVRLTGNWPVKIHVKVSGSFSGSVEAEASRSTQAFESSSVMAKMPGLPGTVKAHATLITQTGGSFEPLTVMVKLHELALPVPSVALQVTVVVPTGKVL